MSVNVRLPDGRDFRYDQSVSVLRVAQDASPGLAASAVAAVLDGKACDLGSPVPDGQHELRLLTEDDPEALEVLRHTAAHVMAQAVVRLYGDGVRYAIGPPLIDDFQYGFYYDFDLPRPVGQEDLPRIEQEMRKVVAERIPLERVELPADEARAEMERLGQRYKVEMIDDLIRGQGVRTVSLYRQGDFLDMCRGPHLPDTGRLRAFRLLATAGAYWRGDERNAMLTRIYGVAFFSQEQLDEHLRRIEEARKRDHRVLGRQLGLFTLSDSVGPGLPLWMPRGAVVRLELETWLRGELVRRGYQIVYTPHIGRLDLYRTSGHYPYYQDSQYPPIQMDRDEGYLLKPMNCPHHIQIYRAVQRSYRDLPVRLAEFGSVYRMEQSGELSGLIRVRGFTQDDAHIFCTPQQLPDEVRSCVELTRLVLSTLGLTSYRVRLGLRGEASDKYVGDAEHWRRAEDDLRRVVSSLGMDCTEEPGDAAFYGPKIDFIVRDCIGRQWQLGTIQVDYNLPERFGLEYVGADNAVHRPVMIHRAPFGSLERFIGILIEHYAGAFPLWLSPVQVAVLPVSDRFNEYAAAVVSALAQAGIRAELDDSPEKIGAKIRRATLLKTPYMAVVGQREADARTVSVRHRTEGDRGEMSLEQFLADLRREIQTKASSCPRQSATV